MSRVADVHAPIDFTLTLMCERIAPRATIRALVYDRTSEQFYSASASIDATKPWGVLVAALEAVCWTLHDHVSRARLGRGPSMSRDGHAQPGDGLYDVVGAAGDAVRVAVPSFTAARQPQPTALALSSDGGAA